MSDRLAASTIEYSLRRRSFSTAVYRSKESLCQRSDRLRCPSIREFLVLELRLLKDSRSFLSHNLAHANSMLSMANPIGMTMRAGPGVTNMIAPSRTTVTPTTVTTIRRASL